MLVIHSSKPLRYTCEYNNSYKLWKSTKLQSFTKYLRRTQDFMQNGALREKFNFCFLSAFC